MGAGRVQGGFRVRAESCFRRGGSPSISPLGWLWVQIPARRFRLAGGPGHGSMGQDCWSAWVPAAPAPPRPRPTARAPSQPGNIPFIPGSASSQAGSLAAASQPPGLWLALGSALSGEWGRAGRASPVLRLRGRARPAREGQPSLEAEGPGQPLGAQGGLWTQGPGDGGRGR